MPGIESYGVYIPLWRLGEGTKGWEYRVEKAIGSYDEDSVTMAVAAGLECLKGVSRDEIDALYFASTTSPFDEKQASPLIAKALGLRDDVFTADFGGSLRSGTIAMKTALDGIKAGSVRKALVVMADMRTPQPRSEFEPVFGDGACAFLLSQEAALEVEDFYTLSDEIYDIWRSKGDVFPRSWEDRFILDEGYFRVLPMAVKNLLSKSSLSIDDMDRVIFYGPNMRRHAEMGRVLRVPKEKLQEPLFSGLGNTGVAFAPMLLSAYIEKAKPGERVLFANYGNGADVFIMRVTDRVEALKGKRGIKSFLASKRILPDYNTYLRWRGLLDVAPLARRPPLEEPSASALWRERDKNIALIGSKCKKCGYPQFPPQRVCAKCGAKDEMEPYRFAEKKAYLFTHANDYLAPTPDPPLIISIINFEGGGRMLTTMTDRVVEEVKVGMPLEMTFRKLHVVGGIHNYYWKCMPLREEVGAG